MTSLIIHLRTAQLIAQHAHHVIKGPAFFADHEKLGEHYEAYADAYDTLVERAIGTTGLDMTESAINLQAASAAKKATDTLDLTDPTAALTAVWTLEKRLQDLVKTHTPSASLGTQNLLAQLADDSESRAYQLRQRLGV